MRDRLCVDVFGGISHVALSMLSRVNYDSCDARAVEIRQLRTDLHLLLAIVKLKVRLAILL